MFKAVFNMMENSRRATPSVVVLFAAESVVIDQRLFRYQQNGNIFDFVSVY